MSTKIHIISAVLFLGVVVFYMANGGFAWAEVQDNLFGWAWSDNIGWLSFNSVNAGSGSGEYGVNVDAAGGLNGYAWSPNIGWVSFNGNDVAGCPRRADNPVCDPEIDRVSGTLSGWARACGGTTAGDCASASRADGWDGWISLRGESPNYGVRISRGAQCAMSGFAWGGPVVGWIDFAQVRGSGLACGAQAENLAVSCSANPNPAIPGEIVRWSVDARGGVPPYSYRWTGSDGLTGEGAIVTKTYSRVAAQSATVTVSDTGGSRATANCTLTMLRFREIQP